MKGSTIKMKGIIFDFNGTLFLDSQLHYDAWRIFSERLRGYPFSDEEMQKYMFGRTNADIIEYATGEKPLPEVVEKLAKEKETLYRNECLKHPEILKLAPGAENFLNWLKDNNIPRTIATMSEWDNVAFYIDIFKLSRWFDLNKIVYSNGQIPGKPAPDIYEIAAANLNLKPEECLVIEDAISGINSAKSAGIGYIIAISSVEPVEYYTKIEGLDGIIRNFDEINCELFDIKQQSSSFTAAHTN